MYDTTIIKEMKELFTIVEIDFYNDGESVQTFVFRANEISENEVWKIYNNYEEQYNSDEFDGAWEDFLQEKGINYSIL
jgi:hypothetical protein